MEEKIKGERSLHAYIRLAWPTVVLCLVPMLAHLPELVGWVHTYPLLFSSQLVLHPDSGVLPGKPFIDGNACGTTLCLGHLAAQDWLHGRLPWWNPYVGVGLPLASEMQPAAFFLPFILLLHFKSGVLLMKLVIQVLAGLACYAFLREIGLVRGAALLGSVLFQCNGTYAWFSDAPVLPIAFLPLLALGVERARTRACASRRGGEAIVALGIAFSILAGHPETALLGGLFCLVWAMFRLRGVERKAAIAFIWKVAVGGLVGLALAAPVLIPFLQDLRISTLGRGGHRTTGLGLVPRHLAALLFPNIYGVPFGNFDLDFWGEFGGYIGAATAFLAFLSVSQRRTSPRVHVGARSLLVAWIIFWLAVSFKVPGVTGALNVVPGLNELWISRYCMPSVEFAFCILAAFALDDDVRSPGRLSVWGPLILFGAGCGLAMLLGWEQVSSSWRQGGWGSWFLAISILWGVGTVLSLFLLIHLPEFALRRYLIGGIVCADAIGLFLPTTLAGLRNPAMFDSPIAYLQANQHLQRAVSVDYSLPANIGALLGVGSLQYYYLPVPVMWGSFVERNLDQVTPYISFPALWETRESVRGAIVGHPATLEALAVRYVVAPSSMDLYITLQDKAGEECFVPTISDRTDCLYNLSSWANSFDRRPMRVFREGGVDIFELPGAAPYAETSGGPCQLAVVDREHMRATCNSPARLIRRELMYPGWTARVNGSAASIVTEGEIFQAIKVPAGVSDIEWRYAPLHASSIAAIFIAGVLALVALVVRSLRAARST